jgi:hypothetical protein
MKQFLIGISLCLISFASLWAMPSLNGYARHYSGWFINDGSQAVLQNTLNLELNGGSGKIAWKANPYIYQYNSSDSLKTGIRQLYLDYYSDNFDLRIGHQQIIWGKADGVFITDIISPKNLEEFLLRDFEEIRSGVTAAKMSYYRGSGQWDLVWVPQFSATKFPADGSIWAPVKPFPVQPLIDHTQESISPSLENSEIFGRYALMSSAMDFELIGGYAWDDDPVYSLKSLQLTPDGPELTLQPKHHRLTIGGIAFNKPIGGWVLRGEGALYIGKQLQLEMDLGQMQSLVQSAQPLPSISLEKNYIHSLIALDFNFLGIDMSTQIIQEAILEYDESLMKEEYEYMATLMLRETFLRETLSLELFTYVGVNDGDALLRPKIGYDFGNGLGLTLGANIFTGDEGMFGQYDSNDMLYAKIRADF